MRSNPSLQLSTWYLVTLGPGDPKAFLYPRRSRRVVRRQVENTTNVDLPHLSLPRSENEQGLVVVQPLKVPLLHSGDGRVRFKAMCEVLTVPIETWISLFV